MANSLRVHAVRMVIAMDLPIALKKVLQFNYGPLELSFSVDK